MDQSASTKFLEEGTGAVKNELLLTKDRVVFVDDVQSSYYDDHFWTFLKGFESGYGAYFVLLGAYGSPGDKPVELKTGNPPIFDSQQRISLTWQTHDSNQPPVGLLLNNDEATDMISRMCQHNADGFIFSEGLMQLMIEVSGGHAGALSGLIDTVLWDSHLRGMFLESEPSVNATSPLDLAIQVIRAFKPSNLRNPPRNPGKIPNYPSEDAYQKEFYRSSDHVVDSNILWSPEFGERWGFEFLREGNDLVEHCSRFREGGKYHKWVQSGEFKDWIILDF
ncbi:hypothetical protein K440DRAFT_635859 [Wilcoxina mikolae CBS 423.85]|nr:hypothetical protein K440DRAFT_635859 [Wilcoxina mikolae CBS 423.85]